MRKEEFLAALRARLRGYSPESVSALTDFCSEMIDDRMEDGMTEEEAVAAAGDLETLIRQAEAELPPVENASLAKEDRFGDNIHTYTAETAVCGVFAECGPADFAIVPSENNVCRAECTENESVRYIVTTENGVLHIRRADSRTLFSLFKAYRSTGSETVRVYLPQGTYKMLEAKTGSGDITVSAGYTFDTVSLHSTSGNITVSTAADSLSAHTASGKITAENLKSTKNGHIETASGKVRLANSVCGAAEIESASGKICLENISCSSLCVESASGKIDLTHTESSGELQAVSASGSIHLEHCDAASLTLGSMSGNVTGTLKTGKIFSAKSKSGRADVPFDSGSSPCKIETHSGNIRIKIAE